MHHSLLSPIQHYLDHLYETFLPLDDGRVADYIPELAHADPSWFGIALVTVDGHVYQSGDTLRKFSIQSISKPLTYGLALEDRGTETVLATVGLEPSGEAFNSISLEPESGRPKNPMINAGAIATTGLIKGDDFEHKLKRILTAFCKYSGHDLTVDDAIYQSERSTGFRNRAIAYLLRNSSVIKDSQDDIVDLYFKQCAISVDCRDLALMAAALANNGINPITSIQALKSRYVENVLSVMSTCGMYDYAGSWLYGVGMPAKSGVAGGILAVLPGQMGIAVYSPRLDDRGNSVRGIEVCKQIARDFDTHVLHTPRSSASVIRLQTDASLKTSHRVRRIDESNILRQYGDCIKLFILHGELVFGSTEFVISQVVEHIDNSRFIIIDFKHVVNLDEAAQKLLLHAARLILDRNTRLLFTATQNKNSFLRYLKNQNSAGLTESVLAHDDFDAALEWCENQLLAEKGCRSEAIEKFDLSRQELCMGLGHEELEYLKALLIPRAYSAGDVVFDEGDPPDALYFLCKGEIGVYVSSGQHRLFRVTTMSSGMVFGEIAFIDGKPRSATIKAETDIECLVCTREHYNRIDAMAESIKKKMCINLVLTLADRLRNANREIAASF